MKKQLLSALCVTATSALVITGCAPRGAVSLTETETVTTVPTTETIVEPTVPETPNMVTTPTELPPPVEVTPVEPVVAPVPEKKTPPAPQPVVYTVTSGDSISALAVRFGLHKPDILALNPELRKNPNAIKIGQKIKLPAGTDISVKAKPRAPKKEIKVGANDTVYTVKAGDVLGGIAISHGVKIADIKKANNLKKDTIFVGQKLTIPGAKAKRPTKPVVSAKDTTKAPEKKVEKKVEKKPEVEAPKVEEPEVPTIEAEEPSLAIDEPAILPEEVPEIEETVPEVPATIPASTTTYIVKEGEDLLAVACRWNISVSTLRAANNIDEAAGYTLAPGTTLIIPNAE